MNDGGPAFPVSMLLTKGGCPEYANEPGMSLRDWFAGQALMGQLATYSHPSSDGNIDPVKEAQVAYAIADAMLKEREK